MSKSQLDSLQKLASTLKIPIEIQETQNIQINLEEEQI